MRTDVAERRPIRPGGADEPRLRVLGSLSLRVGDNDVDFARSARVRRVLAALVINSGELISVDRLAEIAWADSQPVDPRAAIHNLVSRLRTLLAGLDDIELVTQPPGYLLHTSRAAVDATVFEDRVLAARRTLEPADAAAHLDAALALWHGPAYAEFADEEFARAEAARLRVLHELAREQRVEILLAVGANEQAIGQLEGMIADEPLRERPREQRMLALYRAGRLADALRSCRDFRAVLADELGLEPSESLRDLERRMLRRDPTLMLTARPAPIIPTAWSVPTASSVPTSRTDSVAPHAAFAARVGLIGRDTDLDATVDLLLTRPVLTLIGVGGVGKTQLARHLIRRVAGRYPDGIVNCDLGAITDPAEVVNIVAAALDVLPEPGRRLVDQVIDALRSRRALVFLDNCEHVLRTVSELVDQIMSSGVPAQVLATSRERLGVGEEQLWHVHPLPVPTSVELFTARARGVNDAFEPTATLADLARRLDGIPLAIELAAARTSSMTVPEILRSLDDRPRLLDSSRPSVPLRHRSLYNVIDWSYELLSRDRQAVFDQLAVFPDDFSLEAVADIVEPRADLDHAPTVAATVLDLVDRSLVKRTVQDGRSRYVLLDTVRRYGRGHLDERGGIEGLQARHAAWYLGVAEDLGYSYGAKRSDWIRRLDQEMPNLRAAHRWLRSQGDTAALFRLAEPLHHYAINSMNPEVFDWARETLAATGHSDDPLVSVVLATAAHGAWLAGDVEESRTLAARGVALALPGDHPAGRYALLALANAGASPDGDFAGRAELYRRAARLARTVPHRLLADLLYASCVVQLGRRAEGHDLVDEVLREAREIQSPDIEAKAELIHADIMLADEPTRALTAYWRAAELSELAGNRYQAYQTMISAAFAEIVYGDRRTAAATFRTLLTRWPGLLRDAPLFCVLQGVVILLAGAGEHTKAAVLAGAIPPDAVMIAFTVDARALTLFHTVTQDTEADLGAAGFADALDRGRAMDRSEIFDYALATLDLLDSTA